MLSCGQVTLVASQGDRFWASALVMAMTGDGQIAQAGHDARAVGMTDGGAVFVPIPIAYPVQAVFDGPVVAGQAQESLRIGQVGPEAGEQENCFLMDLAMAAVGPAIQPCDLGGEREIDFGALEWAADESSLL
jgi:hypothetical protein